MTCGDLPAGPGWVQGQLFWDSRLSREDAREILQRPAGDSRRRWLVERILQSLPPEDVEGLLGAEDVLGALEDARLPLGRSRMWRIWAEKRASSP